MMSDVFCDLSPFEGGGGGGGGGDGPCAIVFSGIESSSPFEVVPSIRVAVSKRLEPWFLVVDPSLVQRALTGWPVLPSVRSKYFVKFLEGKSWKRESSQQIVS